MSFASPPDATGHLELEELVGSRASRRRGPPFPRGSAADQPRDARGDADRDSDASRQDSSGAEAAAELGLTVVASATLMQAKLTAGCPPRWSTRSRLSTTDAQRAIAFAQIASGRHGGARRDEARRARRRELCASATCAAALTASSRR